jgi:hypothetical protein
VTEQEVGGRLLHASSTEVSEIPSTGLTVGDEIRGTAGQTETGTTISKIEAGNKIILSKAAKATAKELSAKLVNGSTEVKEINTTGLVAGAEVEGTVAGEIEPGTTISEVKAAAIKLSKPVDTEAKEVKGTIINSAEIQEVEGSAGQIESGVTITGFVKTGTSGAITISKNAKPVVKELSGKITSTSSEIKEVNTAGLFVGEGVEAPSTTQIESGATVTGIVKTGTLGAITISVKAKKSETIKLKFYGEVTTLKFYNKEETSKVKIYSEAAKFKVFHPTGYVYNSSTRECHKVEGLPYNEYKESENLYIVKCESGSSYTSEAVCEYPISSGGCSSKATNLNATEDPNHWGVLENPVIDAAILSTKHSWIVDNWTCGATLGTINLWGSIAQYWRGPVGQTGSHGYIKNYNYDDRLANQQPPSFLSPTNATSWKVTRETVPPTTFTG